MPAARAARRNVRHSAFLLTGPVPLRSGVTQRGLWCLGQSRRSSASVASGRGTRRSLSPLPITRSSPLALSMSPTSTLAASPMRRPQAYISRKDARWIGLRTCPRMARASSWVSTVGRRCLRGGRTRFLGEQRPVAIERTRIEEADAAVIGLEGPACATALIAQMQEIGAHLLLAEQVGRALVVGREPADCLDVDVPGPLGKAGKAHVIEHTLTQRGHGLPPFGLIGQDRCPGTRTDTLPAALNDSAPTAKPFSPTAAEASKFS